MKHGAWDWAFDGLDDTSFDDFFYWVFLGFDSDYDLTTMTT
jgi:hypothetical protein